MNNFNIVDDIEVYITTLKDDNILNVVLPSDKNYFLYKYEIYGSDRFYIGGYLERKSDRLPNISINIENNNIIFIKIICSNKDYIEYTNNNKPSNVDIYNTIYYKFFDIKEELYKKNITMEISLDEETIDVESFLIDENYNDDNVEIYGSERTKLIVEIMDKPEEEESDSNSNSNSNSNVDEESSNEIEVEENDNTNKFWT